MNEKIRKQCCFKNKHAPRIQYDILARNFGQLAHKVVTASNCGHTQLQTGGVVFIIPSNTDGEKTILTRLFEDLNNELKRRRGNG